MDQAAFAQLGAWAGLVGGIGGVVAAAWTIYWSVSLRPRVRWTLNRFGARDFNSTNHGLVFYFRHVGTAEAQDVHAVVEWPSHDYELPTTGRTQVHPGEEFEVLIDAAPRSDLMAGRGSRFMSGDDIVYELEGYSVRMKSLRQTFGFRSKKFNLDREQFKVPFVGRV